MASVAWWRWGLRVLVGAALLLATASGRPTPDNALRGNRLLLVVPSESPYASIITDLRGACTPACALVAHTCMTDAWTAPRRRVLRAHRDGTHPRLSHL
jgi:hypothetical protein